MKVIIAGSRSINDMDAVLEAIKLAKEGGINITTLICGMASGVDSLGLRWAEESGIPVEKHPADWDRYGKRAGMIRNKAMSKVAEALIAVFDGQSAGTKNMIWTMRKAGKPVFILWYKYDVAKQGDTTLPMPRASRAAK